MSSVFDKASAARLADLVLETSCLKALAASVAGNTAEAIEIARRASRMAGTEALPTYEVVANLVLARLRRHSGRPHLALHILAALTRVAPRAFAPAMGWEMILSGDETRAAAMRDAATVGAAVASPAARALEAACALVEAARRGDRAAFEEAAGQVTAATAGRADVAAEARALVGALDVEAQVGPDGPDLASWRNGQAPVVPCGLQGVGIGACPDDDDLSTSYAYARPGGPGRRVLLPGLGLLPTAHRVGGTSSGGKLFLRTDAGVAALALAGPAGLRRPDLFRSLYGFAFSPNVHGGAFDLLVHRMRTRLGDAGKILRRGESIAIALEGPVVVLDPRCALPFGDRVLRALVRLGRATTEDAARALRMPLRTVQEALRHLVAEGSCGMKRAGRVVTYRVVDTTFTVESRPGSD